MARYEANVAAGAHTLTVACQVSIGSDTLNFGPGGVNVIAAAVN